MRTTTKDAGIDAIDLKILATIQADADLSAEAISERVHLSPSAVQRRIARLKKNGVIERIAAVVDPKAVGRGFTVLVEIELENENVRAAEPFRRWIKEEKVVQSCWYVTGECDYLLVVLVRNLDEYTSFTERLMNAQLSVRRFKSLVSLMTVKRTLDVDLSADGDED